MVFHYSTFWNVQNSSLVMKFTMAAALERALTGKGRKGLAAGDVGIFCIIIQEVHRQTSMQMALEAGWVTS